jgi:hypothetical protein
VFGTAMERDVGSLMIPGMRLGCKMGNWIQYLGRREVQVGFGEGHR